MPPNHRKLTVCLTKIGHHDCPAAFPHPFQKCYCPALPAWSKFDLSFAKVTTMKTPLRPQLARSLAVLLISLFAISPAWATCGGGGGGGGGGMSGGNGSGSAP